MKNKKALAAAILAAVALGVSAPAFAAPAAAPAEPATTVVIAPVAEPTASDAVTWSGSVRYRFMNQQNADDKTDYRIRLVANADIEKNLSAKIRFAVSGNVGEEEGKNKVDQFSLTYKFADKKSAVTMGKDDVWAGNGLVMDNYFESIQAKTTVGKVDLLAYAGRRPIIDADPLIPTYADDLWGASAQTTMGKLGLGVNYYKGEADKAVSVNANYKFGKVGLAAEFASWDIADNEALVTATIGEAAKKGDTNYELSYYKYVSGNPDTTLDVIDTKGIILAVNHKLADKVTVTLEQHFNNGASGDDLTRATLMAKF